MALQHRAVSGAVKAALALIYPPQCLCCGAAVAATGEVQLCPACWPGVEFLSRSVCDCCGVPLPDDGMSDDGLSEDGLRGARGLVCDDCLTNPRIWSRGRAAMVYGGGARRMVLALKHGDRLDMVPALGGWLARAARPLVEPDQIVVPVPVHPRRLLKRRYNQAAQLGAQVARALGLPHHPALLRRTRHTGTQEGRGRLERIAAQRDAFAVAPDRIEMLADRPVLLIDDVMASGGTVAAAADALLRAGSGPVSVAVLARTLRDP